MAGNTLDTEPLPLRDIHLPDPVSWWPPAPGWWILTGSLVLIAALYFIIKKIRQRKQLQKAALRELDMIRKQYESSNDSRALIQSLSVLLRRSSISFYPRHDVASLTGKKWLQHLDNTAEKKGFLDNEILITAPYLPTNSKLDINAEVLVDLCESWLRVQPVKSPKGTRA